MYNLQLTGGNLIGTRKMSFIKWRKFQQELTVLATTFPHEWQESHKGTNKIWTGKKEVSFKVSIFSNEPFNITEDFKKELHNLSVKYEQDAVALTIAESFLSDELVKGGE